MAASRKKLGRQSLLFEVAPVLRTGSLFHYAARARSMSFLAWAGVR